MADTVIVAAFTSTRLFDDAVIIAASAATGLLDGSSQSYEQTLVEILGMVIVAAFASARLSYRLWDRNLVRSNGIYHLVSSVPEGIVVGRNKSLGEDGQIEVGSFVLDTLQNDMGFHVRGGLDILDVDCLGFEFHRDEDD